MTNVIAILSDTSIFDIDYVDSSGMRLWVTTNMRPLNAAVMELGLEYTDKMAIPPGQKEFALSGYCVSGCTKIVRN